MQHSADFTSLLGHHADIARAERELELRRLADERRALTARTAAEASVTQRRQARRAAHLAVR